MALVLLAGLIVGLGTLGISAVLLESRILITFVVLSTASMAGLAVKKYLVTCDETEETMRRVNGGLASDEE